MEDLSIYNCIFVYIRGEDNTIADMLSRYPQTSSEDTAQSSSQHPHINLKKENLVVLNRSTSTPLSAIAALTDNTIQRTKIEFSIDDHTISKLRDGYQKDPWCIKLISASRGMPNLQVKNGLWFLGDRFIIPADCGMRDVIF